MRVCYDDSSELEVASRSLEISKELMENQMYEEMCASKIQVRRRGYLSRRENEKRGTAATVDSTAFRQISSRRNVNSIRDAVHNVHIFAFVSTSHKVKAARRVYLWVRRHLCDILHAKTSTSQEVQFETLLTHAATSRFESSSRETYSAWSREEGAFTNRKRISPSS